MNRRHFVKAGLAAGVAGAVPGQGSATDPQQYYELRHYELRNDLDPSRLHAFFREHFVPAMKEQGLGPIGCFTVVSGQATPALWVVIPYNSLNQLKSVTQQVRSDSSFVKAWKSLETGGTLPYVRYHSALLRAFAAHPRIEVPPAGEGSHLFELRIYESKNAFDLAAKVDMFNQEEIEVFRKCGFRPVFFGEGLIDRQLPHLTYLVAFRDMADREKAWGVFRDHPDWIRIKDRPEWKDTVSSIRASFLSATDYSQIR